MVEITSTEVNLIIIVVDLVIDDELFVITGKFVKSTNRFK